MLRKACLVLSNIACEELGALELELHLNSESTRVEVLAVVHCRMDVLTRRLFVYSKDVAAERMK